MLYRHFARLIAERDVDRAPLQLVADAFMRCRQISVEPVVERSPAQACIALRVSSSARSTSTRIASRAASASCAAMAS